MNANETSEWNWARNISEKATEKPTPPSNVLSSPPKVDRGESRGWEKERMTLCLWSCYKFKGREGRGSKGVISVPRIINCFYYIKSLQLSRHGVNQTNTNNRISVETLMNCYRDSALYRESQDFISVTRRDPEFPDDLPLKNCSKENPPWSVCSFLQIGICLYVL